MSNFGKAKKYYTNSEIEARTKKLLSDSEIRISQQNDIIIAQNAKIEKQQKDIKELVRREKLIRNALINATDSAKIAYDIAKAKRKAELVRLQEFLEELNNSILLNKPITLRQTKKLEEIISDFKSGVGEGELARRRELEAAREKLEKVNKETKEAQKTIDERYRAVLEKYEALKSSQESDSFSIDEALNPTATLEEIMKDIFKK